MQRFLTCRGRLSSSRMPVAVFERHEIITFGIRLQPRLPYRKFFGFCPRGLLGQGQLKYTKINGGGTQWPLGIEARGFVVVWHVAPNGYSKSSLKQKITLYVHLIKTTFPLFQINSTLQGPCKSDLILVLISRRGSNARNICSNCDHRW